MDEIVASAQVVLEGVDKISPATTSAEAALKKLGQTAADVQRQLIQGSQKHEETVKVLNKIYEDNQRKVKGAGDEAVRSSKQAAEGLSYTAKAAQDLQRQLTRAFSVVAIEEFVRRSYIAFANQEQQMKRVQVATGATAEQIKQLKGEFQGLAGATGHTTEQMATAFIQFQTRSGLGNGEARRAFESIAKASYEAGIEVQNMGAIAASAMANLHVSIEDIPQLMGGLAKAFAGLGSESARTLPNAIALIERMGATGKDQLQSLVAAQQVAAKLVGNVEAGDRALQKMLQQLGDPTTTMAGLAGARGLLEEYRKGHKNSADIIKFYADQASTIMKRHTKDIQGQEQEMDRYFGRDLEIQQLAMNAANMSEEDNRKLYEDAIKKQRTAKEANKEYEEFIVNSKRGLQELSQGWNNLETATAGVLDTLGATDILHKTVGDLKVMKELLDWLDKFVKDHTNKGETPTVGGAAHNWLQNDARPSMPGLESLPPFMQSGGVVTQPTMAMIGEAGPEAVVPLSGGGGGADMRGAEGGTQAEREAAEMWGRLHGLAGAQRKHVSLTGQLSDEELRELIKSGMGASSDAGGGGGGGGGRDRGWGPGSGRGTSDSDTPKDGKPGDPKGGGPGAGGPKGPVDKDGNPLFPTPEQHPGGAAGIPGLAGGPSGPSLTHEERIAAAKAGGAVPGKGEELPGVPKALSDWVAKKENFQATAFNDFGQVNIGYGTAARGRKTITHEEARKEMNAELQKHLAAIDKMNPNLPPGARIALASLAFNTGGSWYTKEGGHTGLANAVRAGDLAKARQIFLQYSKAQGKTLPGLQKRRNQEAAGWDDPEYFYKGSGTTAAEDFGGKQDPHATTGSSGAPQPSAAVPIKSIEQVAGAPGGPSGPELTHEQRIALGTGGSSEAGGGGGGDKATAGADRVTKGRDLAGVDPILVQAIHEGSKFLPDGYTIRPTSGLRPGDRGFHGKGEASDWQIYDRDGKPVENRGWDKENTRLYSLVARGSYGWLLKNHPNLAKRFGWGGAFPTGKDGKGPPDLMHFDFGGQRGRWADRQVQKMGPLYPTEATQKATEQAKSSDPATRAEGRRQLVFLHGMGYGRPGFRNLGTPDQIRSGIDADMQRVAAANDQDLHVIAASGDNPAEQEKQLRAYLKEHPDAEVEGFSQGGFTQRRLQKEFPKAKFTELGTGKGGSDPRFPGVSHMKLPRAEAERAEAGKKAREAKAAPKPPPPVAKKEAPTKTATAGPVERTEQAGGTTTRATDAPKLAEGGIVNRPTEALVGEAGPEAIIPLDGAGASGAVGDLNLDSLLRQHSELQAHMNRNPIEVPIAGARIGGQRQPIGRSIDYARERREARSTAHGIPIDTGPM